MAKAVLKNKRFWLLWAALALLGLLAAAIVAALLLFTARVNGELYVRGDLIDVRDAELSTEQFEQAQQAYPDDLIRWSVPLSGGRYDSLSEELAVTQLTEEDFALFHYFPHLKRIDAHACADYAALAAADRRFPELEISWTVPYADGEVSGTSETLTVKTMTPQQIDELLQLLPHVRCVDLRESALSDAEVDAFAAGHEELEVLYTVSVWGLRVPDDCESLRPADGRHGSLEELKAALGRLHQLREVDLTDTGLLPSELRELLPLCGEAETRYEILLDGHRYEPDSELIDLSGEPFTDFEELDAAISLMHGLKKVDMCDCGIPDEEMDALNRRYPTVQLVWRVHFSIYSLRTDATVFCASDLPELAYLAPELNDWELAPIKYCTELIALDLGHMKYTDISFLYEMPHLRYLIMVETHLHDITPIGSLEELEYLEIFINRIDDISPLLNCKKLKHLNICFTGGYDPTPLTEMTWLERLWAVGVSFPWSVRQQLPTLLPDTVCYMPASDPQGSTGGGWRENDAYFEMRDVFGMYYQPGGTGIH